DAQPQPVVGAEYARPAGSGPRQRRQRTGGGCRPQEAAPGEGKAWQSGHVADLESGVGPPLWLLDKSLQAVGGIIPLSGDLIKIVSRLLEAYPLELVDPLPPAAGAAHQAGVPQGMEMTGDRLPRHAG